MKRTPDEEAANRLLAKRDRETGRRPPCPIEDVPWVMYFENPFELHGAFWHSAFGGMRSRGCVNMSPRDARWIFQWSEPQLPVGWHGV